MCLSGCGVSVGERCVYLFVWSMCWGCGLFIKNIIFKNIFKKHVQSHNIINCMPILYFDTKNYPPNYCQNLNCFILLFQEERSCRLFRLRNNSMWSVVELHGSPVYYHVLCWIVDIVLELSLELKCCHRNELSAGISDWLKTDPVSLTKARGNN